MILIIVGALVLV